MQQVILMFGLRLPEITGGGDFGHDLAGPQARGVHVSNRIQRGLFLRVVEGEDRRAIAYPQIVALPVRRGRVVDLEVEFQQRAIAGLGRIIDDLDRLGMGAVVAIGRVCDVAACVADAGGDHARQLADQILHTPETAARQNCPFAHFSSSSSNIARNSP
ncbi:hypothetical protein GALL_492910 [mine drainage metagenome]|uniref:Uncharacterized protein n=1 Tax=mine drainage metagenome TaxID=410659 RepID=A0A1J5PNE5_9ZZZZ